MLSERLRRRACLLRARQWTQREIAAQLGVSRLTVQRWLKRLPTRASRLRARLRQAARLHAQQYSQREIAERMGVSQQAVYQWFKRLGLPAWGYATERSYRKRCEARAAVECIKRMRRQRAEVDLC